MRITKHNEGYTLKVTDHEFAIIERLLSMVDRMKLWDAMPTGERRSWSRRVGLDKQEPFLRVDRDKRKW